MGTGAVGLTLEAADSHSVFMAGAGPWHIIIHDDLLLAAKAPEMIGGNLYDGPRAIA